MLDLLFPSVCLGCQALLWRPADGPFCGRCAPEVVALPANTRTVDAVTSLFAYEGPLQRALARFKYHGNPAWAGPLGALLARAPELAADPAGRPWDAIVPIPLHWRRLLARGFNQSLLLARSARRHGTLARVRLETTWLRRTRATPPQAELDAATRQHNLRDAFAVPHPARVRGRHILLVDDVTTTGATLAEASRALLHAGAAHAGALTLMRTL